MRIGMVSTLSVLLPLIYSPRPAAAQFNPAGPQSVRQDEFKPALWYDAGGSPENCLAARRTID